jgi:hypothetical protein
MPERKWCFPPAASIQLDACREAPAPSASRLGNHTSRAGGISTSVTAALTSVRRLVDEGALAARSPSGRSAAEHAAACGVDRTSRAPWHLAPLTLYAISVGLLNLSAFAEPPRASIDADSRAVPRRSCVNWLPPQTTEKTPAAEQRRRRRFLAFRVPAKRRGRAPRPSQSNRIEAPLWGFTYEGEKS